jgi:hypothetical protein
MDQTSWEIAMSRFRNTKALSVNRTGAGVGRVLRGSGLNNQGIRLKVLQEQARGNEGAITGGFVILDGGSNMHSLSLGPLVHRVTDAGAVAGVIRRLHPGCVNVANANILVLEQL